MPVARKRKRARARQPMSSSRMNSRQCWTDHEQPKGALLSLSVAPLAVLGAPRERGIAHVVSLLPFPARFPFRAGKSIPIPNAAHCRRFHATLAFGVGAPCILRYILHGGSRVERGPRAGGRTDGPAGQTLEVSSSGEPLPALHLELNLRILCESFKKTL